MLAEQGRLVYWVVNTFAQAGLKCFVQMNYGDKDIPRLAEKAVQLPGVEIVEKAPRDSDGALYVFDVPDPKLVGNKWAKQIQLGFDVFSVYPFQKPLILPFPIHPVHYEHGTTERIETLRSSMKDIRILFSGDFRGYDKTWVTYPDAKLPRARIVEILREKIPDRVFFVNEQSQLDSLLINGCTDRCVLIDTSRLWIDDRIWLQVLARAEFFLAPPGIVMPMCHNIVEAMAVGTVPITNYPEWFDPDLGDGVECLCFGDAPSLINAVECALAMPQDCLQAMRRHAIRYYEQHLTPESFVRKVQGHPSPNITVLLLTEKYVAQNTRRLGPRSVLIRGVDKAGRWAWVRELLRFGRGD
jgi:hypothetical protein